MKLKTKWSKIILFVCSIFLLLLCHPVTTCHADEVDDGFYIEHMDVHVVANTDRSYDIVETIDVYFTEKRHGIIRDIPTYSSTEREIRLENVNVTGAPFKYDGYGTITIGDPDKTLKGKQRYVISYTLWHYADSELDADYLYLNLIGTDWNTYIKDFDATIQLPESSVIEECTLTGGTYGSKDTDMASYTIHDNIIQVEGTRTLDAYEGVTILVKLPEGTFSTAQVWLPDIIFHNITSKYTLDEYGTLTVERTYDATNNNATFYHFTIDDSIDDLSKKKVVSSITLPNQTVITPESDYLTIGLTDYIGQGIQFSIRYQISYKVNTVSTHANLIVCLNNYHSNELVEHLTSTLQLPFEVGTIELSKYSENYSSYQFDPKDSYELLRSDDSKEVTIKNPGYENRDIYLHLSLLDTKFVRNQNFFDYFVPMIGVIALGIIIYLLIKRKRILNPVPLFYAPDGMNPADLGYVIDEVTNQSDVISLIYYWASKGLLRIQFQEHKHFTLYKLSDMNGDYQYYEKKLFKKLWTYGTSDMVTDQDLSKKFYTPLNKAMKNVGENYKNKKCLIDPKSIRLSRIFGLLFPLCYLLLVIIADGFLGFGVLSSVVMSFFFYLGLLLLNWFSTIYAKKRYRNNSKLGISILCIFTAIFLFIYYAYILYGTVFNLIGTSLSFLCLILFSILGPFFRARTPYGQEVLEKAIGFRMFLITAEKTRLQLLLDENPDYYYDILPYAQVLGVTNQWIHKFDDLTINAPSWISNDSFDDMNHYLLFQNLSKSISNSMTSSPTSTSSSGGFSGGGSSGGGSGGGGGSSW